MKERNENQVKEVLLKSKPRYEIIDGLRGIASITVVIFHFFETYSWGHPEEQIINHGYLAVDFFYLLSGFVICYAYDDRWDKMSLWDFYKRRLVRLHPMVIAGTLVGVCYIFFSECEIMTNIKNPNPIIFFVSIIMSFLMIPAPRNIDIRGLHESNGINGTMWTLHYEYLSNILYSIIIRRINTIFIAIITVLSSFLTINLTFNFDVFGVLKGRDDRKYTVIGGWEISSCELYIGFARLLYPFFCGYLISRLRVSIKIPYSFWICSILLILSLCLPRFSSNGIINGFYESFIIIIIFPLIIIIGAGDTEKNEKLLSICKFLGEISYPLYITHYPIIYWNMAWYEYHKDDSLFNIIGISVGSFIIMMFNTYALIKLYDEPIRKWLTLKYLTKNKPKKVKNEIEEEKKIDERLTNGIMDNSEE